MSTTAYIKLGNTSPILQQTLQDSAGVGVNLVSAAVRIHVNTINGTNIIDAAATIVTAADGIVSYTFDGTLTEGNYWYEFEATYSDSSIETFPNSGYNLLVVERVLA